MAGARADVETQTATWLDEGEVSPEWAPPAGDPVRRSRLPGSLVYGGVVLALVLLLAVVWGAGGFGRRTDQLRPVVPGALFSTGPYEFAFTEATAQQHLDTDKNLTKWEIVVIGQARTTSHETIAPEYFGDGGMFVIRDPASQTVATAASALIGDIEGLGDRLRTNLVPGLPLTGYRLTFTFPVSYQPGPTIRFVISDLVYEDRNLVTDEKAWHNGTYAYSIELPVRVLSPKE